MDEYKSRKQNRLIDYDYSTNGYYFVTICTHDRVEHFGKIRRGTIFCALNDGGKIAKKYWYEIPNHYQNVECDEFVIMPNHTHGILFIKNDNHTINDKRAQDIVPLRNRFQHIIPGSLGSIIRGYKIGLTKWYRQNTNIHTLWQKSFYDHIIRDEQSLNNIRQYIINNPINWNTDENNVEKTDVN